MKRIKNKSSHPDSNSLFAHRTAPTVGSLMVMFYNYILDAISQQYANKQWDRKDRKERKREEGGRWRGGKMLSMRVYMLSSWPSTASDCLLNILWYFIIISGYHLRDGWELCWISHICVTEHVFQQIHDQLQGILITFYIIRPQMIHVSNAPALVCPQIITITQDGCCWVSCSLPQWACHDHPLRKSLFLQIHGYHLMSLKRFNTLTSEKIIQCFKMYCWGKFHKQEWQVTETRRIHFLTVA